MNYLLSLLFGCRHQHMTFPITPRRAPKAPYRGCYISCLDCGKEFAYNWDSMQVGSPISAAPAPLGELAGVGNR